jgi:hypothetical protein
MLLAQVAFRILIPVSQAEATWPEDNLTRHRATQNKAELGSDLVLCIVNFLRTDGSISARSCNG